MMMMMIKPHEIEKSPVRSKRRLIDGRDTASTGRELTLNSFQKNEVALLYRMWRD